MSKTPKAVAKPREVAIAKEPLPSRRKITGAARKQPNDRSKPKAGLPTSNSGSTASTKKELITQLLSRVNGVAMAELAAATGWQFHSLRAVMTGLRKTGVEISRTKDATGTTLFRIASRAE